MSVKFARVVLGLYGAMFLYFGVLLFVKPTALSDALPVELVGPVAVAEIRAFYGGLEIGLGIFLLAAGFRREMLRAGLWLLLLISAGLTLGRSAGIAIDRAVDSFLFVALAVELAGVALSAISIRLTRGTPRNP